MRLGNNALDAPDLVALEVTTTVLVIVAVISRRAARADPRRAVEQVRDEPPMDPEVEAKLLLHRNPDEPTGELPATG